VGNPILQLLPPDHTPQQYAETMHILGYDRPVLTQYADFFLRATSGDLGWSPIYNRPALEVVLTRLPTTFILAFGATVVAIVIGIPLGVVGGYRSGGVIDNFGLIVASIGQAMPTFVIAIVLILVFGVHLKILPVAGLAGPSSYVLPISALSLWAMAALIRFARSGTQEVMTQAFVLLAKAKGLSEGRILSFHILRAAVLPVITFGGLQFGALMSGALMAESVFAIPGIGKLALDAVFQRDNHVVRASVLVIATSFILINLLTDLCYVWLDPRVRL
jgi:peptide/nickel transport system permease protein